MDCVKEENREEEGKGRVENQLAVCDGGTVFTINLTGLTITKENTAWCAIKSISRNFSVKKKDLP